MKLVKKSEGKFDKLIMHGLLKIPKIGTDLNKFYVKKAWFQRFTKYGLWLTIEYWLVKGPITIFFTDILGLWYVISAFIAGVICALIGFVLSEFWIWREKHGKV